MPTVTIKPPDALLAELRQKLSPQQFKQAIWQAVSRTTNKGRTQARQAAKDLTGLPAKHVNKAIVSTLTRTDNPTGSITVTRAGMPLSAYKVKVSKSGGVTSEGTKGMQQLAFRHGFKATMKSGHTGVYLRARGVAGVLDQQTHPRQFVPLAQRVIGGQYSSQIYIQGVNQRKRALSRGSASGVVRRLPIVEIMGRPIIDAVNTDAVIASIKVDVNSEMRKQLTSQLNRFLKVSTHGRTH